MLKDTMYKDVICDNNMGRGQSYKGSDFLHTPETKLVLIQTELLNS